MAGTGNPPAFMVGVPETPDATIEFAQQTSYFFLKQAQLAPIASNIKCGVLHLRKSGDMPAFGPDPLFRNTRRSA
jgi:hypothetical protein